MNLEDERGAATVAAVAMVGMLLAMTGGGMCLGSAVIGRHRAQAAADLAALAAADRLPAGVGSGCERARQLVHRMGGNQIGCRAEDLDIIVTVEVPVAFSGWVGGPARAAARAGPA